MIEHFVAHRLLFYFYTCHVGLLLDRCELIGKCNLVPCFDRSEVPRLANKSEWHVQVLSAAPTNTSDKQMLRLDRQALKRKSTILCLEVVIQNYDDTDRYISSSGRCGSFGTCTRNTIRQMIYRNVANI